MVTDKDNGRLPSPTLLHLHFPSSSSLQKDVSYSCGYCGYELNLSSCSRNTEFIGSKYRQSMKRGIIIFYSIDASKFMQIEELRFIPHFTSMFSWGLFQRRTKLLCQQCRQHIGNAYKPPEGICLTPSRRGGSDLKSWDGLSDQSSYHIKIRALQPSFSKDFQLS